jgi:hypothetical protein
VLVPFWLCARCLPGKAARQGNNVVVCAAMVDAGSAGDFSDYCAPAIITGYEIKGYE